MNDILMAYRDGPADQPNGWYLVRILNQSSNRNAFICEIVSLLKAGSGIPHEPGQKIESFINTLWLHWRE